MVAQTRHAGQASPTKLAFKDKLSTKTQTTDTLLRKLKNLHSALNDLDQENVELGSLATVKQDLLAPSILLHTDRGIKAYAACCLVDILGLYAPEAPYTEDELVDIFKFITVQLGKGLKQSSDTYFPQYFHILESLSSVKSVVLICDLPNGDTLINNVFRDFFTLIRKDFSKQVENFMADILVALIDEAPSLPSASMDTIIAQFGDKNISTDAPAYRLAVNVCRQTGDKLQRHVSMYFSELMVEYSEEEDLTEIRKAHALIKHIHASCPNLLHSVIPQLEEQCKVDDIPVRTLATETLGDMYADKGGADLAKKYPGTFKVWLARMNDIVTTVRIKAVESTRDIFNQHAELRDSIEDMLQVKVMDPDERVRTTVSKLYGQVDFEIILHHVPRDHLQNLAGRATDKKQSVRAETLKTLGKLYNLAYPLIENQDPTAIRQFAWIPNSILPLVGMNKECRPSVEQTIADLILPLPSSSAKDKSDVDETRWTDRLLTVMVYLEDEKATTTLLAATNLRSTHPSPYQRYLTACIAHNGGVIDDDEELVKANLARLIKQHSLYFHDPSKAAEDLEGFAELNDQTLYKLLQKCMDPQTDVKSLVKRKDEFLKKIADKAVGISGTMTIFLRRAMYHILNQSSIPTLLRRVEEGQSDRASPLAGASGQQAALLLKYASKNLPIIFQAHQSLLTKAISNGEEDEESTLTSVALRALSCLVRWQPDLGSTDKRMVELYGRYATGGGEKHAKFAARLLAHTPNQSAACGRVVDTLSDNLQDASPEELVAHVSALAQFSLFAPDAFESKSDVITEFLVKKLLMKPSPAPEKDDEQEDDEEWAEDNAIPPLYQAKVLALKTFRNRCRAYAGTDKAALVSEPPFKIFHKLIETNGSLSTNVDEDPVLLSRLRLAAALSLIQLSAVTPAYAKPVLTHFKQLALVCQDSCYNVRYKFLTKLIALLPQQKLPEVYNIIPFLTVHDPDNDLRATASQCISATVRRLSPDACTKFFGSLFLRFLHFLAHHPDFVETHKDLQDHSKYVRHYLDLVATADNIPLLYYFAVKGKTVHDTDSQYSRKFWIMCELAQELIRAFAKSKKWPMTTYPGKVKLPSDILRAPKTLEEGQKMSEQVYLPEETIEWVEKLYSSKGGEVKERKPPKRKAPATTNHNGNGPKRRRKKRKSESRDQDDDEDDEGEDDEDDDGASRKATSDVEMADAVADDVGEEDEPSGEEQLGRGARQKAKRKAKRKTQAKG